MATYRVNLHHVTLYFLALCLAFLGAGAVIPDGSCYLKDEVRNDLVCSTGVLLTSSNAYLAEQNYCRHRLSDQCLTCIDGSLKESVCPDAPITRQKRGWWFFGRRRRRSPPPVTNTAPRITCPFIGNRIIAPQRSDAAIVTWSEPKVSDSENNIQSTKLITGKPSGSSFGAGTHSVTYKVTDTHGLSSSCTVTFKVEVIRCPAPRAPTNGIVQCPSTIGTVAGTKCTFSCNTGYQISGPATAWCQNSAVFTASPTCQKIQCGNPPVPSNAKSVSCSDGNRYQSVCSLVCSQGYLPSRGARSVCYANKKWTSTSWTCEDDESPVFTSCPTKKINTIDKKFKWTVAAIDSSGKVTLTQVQGHPSGSLMEFGTHLIKYVATDAAGNTATCAFSVELKVSDCPRPTAGDSDMKFTCNGLTSQSVCHLSCTSGSFVQGSKYIACVHDTSENNTSYWQPIDGEKATCHRKRCPTLSPPKNGALACDKQLGGTVCQIQCDDRYDVSPGEGTPATFICGKNSDLWTPSNVVPDCLEMAYPDEYSLPSEFFYFMGDCSDAQALNNIKQQFIDNLNSIGLSPCMSDTCSVDDINVTCGENEAPIDFNFRRRRSANPATRGVLHVRLTFHVKNSNRTLSPVDAVALLKSLATKSKNMMSTNPAMRTMLLKSARRPAISPASGFSAKVMSMSVSPGKSLVVPSKVQSTSVTGNMSVVCADGSVPSKSGVCVPCSIGTYSSLKSKTCKPCPLNSYQDQPGSLRCKPCSKHQNTSSTGAANRAACQELCRKDTFSSTGFVPCFPCPSATHQPAYGAKTCVACSESRIVGQVSTKCLNKATNATTMSSKLKISNFLLTCGAEECLSF